MFLCGFMERSEKERRLQYTRDLNLDADVDPLPYYTLYQTISRFQNV
jgi:hypothetical protein